MQGAATAPRQQRVRAALQRDGLGGMEDRRLDARSGGQQRRVAFARAIAAQPAGVLAGEPTATVDPETATMPQDPTLGLNQERGVTSTRSTHEPPVMQRATRVVRAVDGRIQPGRGTSDTPPPPSCPGRRHATC